MKMQLKIDGQYFNVEVGDVQARPIQVKVDGQDFEVWLEENKSGDELLENEVAPCEPAPLVVSTQSGTAQADTSSSVTAPIPGVILSVSVKPGDKVEFGQELLVLEAMKMKNIIRANHAATIAAVRVANGDHVKHNQPLIDYVKP
jgi:glutaconyl-CoA/methylmalonyl-CoA decarboxylase subunit gamma